MNGLRSTVSLALALIAAVLPSRAVGQTRESQGLLHRVSIGLGSLEVPVGCVSVLTGGEVDFFLGNLEGPCPRVLFATGMVAMRPSKKTSGDYPRLMHEKLAGGEIVYGIRTTGHEKVIDAAVERATFSARILRTGKLTVLSM